MSGTVAGRFPGGPTAAELIKLRTAASTYLLLGLPLLLDIASRLYLTRHMFLTPEGRRDYPVLGATFGTTMWTYLATAAAVFGALALTGEHASGLVRTTLTAVPSRWRVVAAKAWSVAGVAALAGTVTALVSFGVARDLYRSKGIPMGWGYAGVPRALSASVLLVVVAAVVGLALAALLRGTAATMTAVCAVVALLPSQLAKAGTWGTRIADATPVRAWQTLVERDSAGAWAVYALWTAAAVVAAGWALGRQDV